jgi:aminopeptidase YwaD
MPNTRLFLPMLFALVFTPASGLAFEKLKTDFAFIPEAQLQQFAHEVSGEAAKRNLDTITLYHRTRGSEQFLLASEFILSKLKEYGYQNAEIMTFAADGKTLFGTQKSRLAWQVKSAELWEVSASGKRLNRLADWDSMPLTLAQDSLSADVSTTLIDIGSGTQDSDYQGKDIKGRLVLTDSQPGAISALAIAKYGAAGIVSYAPNQRTAWWKEDENLIRWGHLSSFPADNEKTFAFMISLKQARAFQTRLQKGESIHFHARVDAALQEGEYSMVSALLEGSDAKLKQQEILLTCHLDHPRPGANDNASGCVSILETARTLVRLIDQGLIARPKRSIRFIWPAEIEGSLIYLNAKPELAKRIKANIHMDMVGGSQTTKSVYRISAGPMSQANFIGDLGQNLGQVINEQTLAYASGEPSELPLVAKEGGKEPLLAQMEGLSMGSDHDVLRDSSWGIPGLYLHDWPDRYIHTNFDLAANIDPTKLKRSAFIGAVSAWILANYGQQDVPATLALLKQNSLKRAGQWQAKLGDYDVEVANHLAQVYWQVELDKLASIEKFAAVSDSQKKDYEQFIVGLAALLTPNIAKIAKPDSSAVYHRNNKIKGLMHGFGYSYLEDKLDKASLESLHLDEEQAYEALNLVDGKRSVQQIHHWLMAEFGPVAMTEVDKYLKALAKIQVIQ